MRARMPADEKARMAADISGHQHLYQRRSAVLGQSTIEYAVVIAVVTGALVAMQIYLKRGLAGRHRQAADAVGEQFSPRHTTGTMTTVMQGTTTTDSHLELRPVPPDAQGNPVLDAQGNPATREVVVTTTTIDAPETTARAGNETVEALDSEPLNE